VLVKRILWMKETVRFTHKRGHTKLWRLQEEIMVDAIEDVPTVRIWLHWAYMNLLSRILPHMMEGT
jgi:hypothetical protein